MIFIYCVILDYTYSRWHSYAVNMLVILCA